MPKWKFWKDDGRPAKTTGPTQRESLLKRQVIFDITDDNRFVVDSNEFSRHDYEMLRLRMPELEKLKKKGEKMLPHFHELQVDFYQQMYKGQPRFKGKGEVYRDFQPHILLCGWMDGMEELKSLQSSTTRNKLASLVAVKKLNKILEDMPKETRSGIRNAQNRGENLRNAERRLEALRRLWEAAEEAGDEEMMERLKEMGAELSDIVQESKDAADKAVEDALQSMEDNKDEIRDSIRDQLGQAKTDVNDTKDQLRNMGCGRGRGHSRHTNEEQMIELSTQIQEQPDLKRIAKIAGRMSHIIENAKKNRNTWPGGEIVDTELAGDISRLTGSELANFAHDDLEMELFGRLHDGRATCWTKESDVELGKGPIICAVDSSGSMDGAAITWAKAVACMMYRECKNRNQPFTMVHFSSSDIAWSGEWTPDKLRRAIETEDGFEKMTFQPAGDDGPFLDFATTFHSGGTDYELAFGGIQDCFDDPKAMNRADVVFISDEAFPVHEHSEIIDKFRATIDLVRGKVLGVSIGSGESPGPYYGDMTGDKGKTAFDHFCDSAWALNLNRMEDEIPVVSEMFVDQFQV